MDSGMPRCKTQTTDTGDLFSSPEWLCVLTSGHVTLFPACLLESQLPLLQKAIKTVTPTGPELPGHRPPAAVTCGPPACKVLAATAQWLLRDREEKGSRPVAVYEPSVSRRLPGGVFGKVRGDPHTEPGYPRRCQGAGLGPRHLVLPRWTRRPRTTFSFTLHMVELSQGGPRRCSGPGRDLPAWPGLRDSEARGQAFPMSPGDAPTPTPALPRVG